MKRINTLKVFAVLMSTIISTVSWAESKNGTTQVGDASTLSMPASLGCVIGATINDKAYSTFERIDLSDKEDNKIKVPFSKLTNGAETAGSIEISLTSSSEGPNRYVVDAEVYRLDSSNGKYYNSNMIATLTVPFEFYLGTEKWEKNPLAIHVGNPPVVNYTTSARFECRWF